MIMPHHAILDFHSIKKYESVVRPIHGLVWNVMVNGPTFKVLFFCPSLYKQHWNRDHEIAIIHCSIIYSCIPLSRQLFGMEGHFFLEVVVMSGFMGLL